MSRLSQLPPPTPASRGSSGISRLAMMQARIQAQQMADKENKLLQFLEDRQEAAIRRVAYGRDASYSATSLSSNSSNSMTAGVGVRPVPTRMASGLTRQNSNFQNDDYNRRLSQHEMVHSPNGWDKSYPLKPMDHLPQQPAADPRTPMYKRNNSASSAGGGSYGKPNKYSGNYGPRGDYVRTRGLSLDRSRYSSPVRAQPGYNLPRTRSQAQLGHSSGEDSYGSSSRPPSSHQLYGMMSTSAYAARPSALPPAHPVSAAQPHWRDLELDDLDDEISSPRISRKTSYTREYVRNLPVVVTHTQNLPAPNANAAKNSRFSKSQPGRLNEQVGIGSTFEHSSYSSQSSDKSDPPNYPKRSPSFDREGSAEIYKFASNPRINSQTYRKTRSPSREIGPRQESPDRRSVGFGSDDTDRMNNNNNNNMNGNAPTSNNNILSLQRQREEEKRQLQLEMRRREQELLNKIKEQQKALETMKQEKLKYEKEIQRQELLRKQEEEKRREQELLQQQQQQQQLQQARRTDELARPKIRETPLTHRKRFLSRSSSSNTIGTNRPSEEEEEEIPPPRNGRACSINRTREVSSTPSLRRKPPPAVSSVPSQPPQPQPARTTVRRSAPSPNPQRRQVSPRKAPVEQQSRNGAPEQASSGPARRSIFAPKARDDLVPCSNCGRNFAEDRIEKHSEICIKTSKKKRKVFDMTKKRVQGTEAEQFLRKPGRSFNSKSVNASSNLQVKNQKTPGKKGDWRKKREEFIAALRAAKEAQRHIAAGGKISDLPPPPPMDTSDYVQCPHCGRKFSDAAAERHIPKCKNIKSNKR